MQDCEHVDIFDCAYQDVASGNPEIIKAALRLFVEDGHDIVPCHTINNLKPCWLYPGSLQDCEHIVYFDCAYQGFTSDYSEQKRICVHYTLVLISLQRCHEY